MQFKKAVEDYKKDHPFPMLMRRRRGGDRQRAAWACEIYRERRRRDSGDFVMVGSILNPIPRRIYTPDPNRFFSFL
ncbi:hypothetical protein HPP92_017279 [Vanilla planifolia]|uniref:Uncharacterized protein n=1 Tax=Vanilla planifolia TaxID=51239 RepID=A0A835QJ59_VANPL|nr:hypothetical protein HPP92_017279 [Vanilla planifolia]